MNDDDNWTDDDDNWTYVTSAYDSDSENVNIPTQFENEKLDFKNCKYILQCYYKYLGNMSKTSDCSICTNDNSKEKCVILRTCGHKFHQRCIDKWFESKDTCPNCRKKCDVTPSLIKMDVSIKKLKNICKI